MFCEKLAHREHLCTVHSGGDGGGLVVPAVGVPGSSEVVVTGLIVVVAGLIVVVVGIIVVVAGLSVVVAVGSGLAVVAIELDMVVTEASVVVTGAAVVVTGPAVVVAGAHRSSLASRRQHPLFYSKRQCLSGVASQTKGTAEVQASEVCVCLRALACSRACAVHSKVTSALTLMCFFMDAVLQGEYFPDLAPADIPPFQRLK